MGIIASIDPAIVPPIKTRGNELILTPHKPNRNAIAQIDPQTIKRIETPNIH